MDPLAKGIVVRNLIAIVAATLDLVYGSCMCGADLHLPRTGCHDCAVRWHAVASLRALGETLPPGADRVPEVQE